MNLLVQLLSAWKLDQKYRKQFSSKLQTHLILINRDVFEMSKNLSSNESNP